MADLCSNAIVPMWKPEWTARFESILHDYQSTVTAAFAGHDHTDDFRVLRANEPGEAFVLIDPPVSPIYGQNPAFRVVSFTEGGRLANQSTYYLTNLTSAGSAVPGNWTREYSFVEEWQREQLDSASLKSVYDRVRSDAAVRARWLSILNVRARTILCPPRASETWTVRSKLLTQPAIRIVIAQSRLPDLVILRPDAAICPASRRRRYPRAPEADSPVCSRPPGGRLYAGAIGVGSGTRLWRGYPVDRGWHLFRSRG